MSIRFDGQVAIVTGAGQGLGRSHALALAQRGANVVVNDLGGATDGTGATTEAARKVVDAIKAAGGEAIADGANVARFEEVEAMVAAAMKQWGRVDILANNAGILRDKTFANMTLEDFRAVLDVHVMGSVHCTKAVWEIMRGQSYGRIVLTSSSSGLYGNFGQANYSTAKMALVGLMNTLHLEGQKYNIRVNALSPCAATRMTADIMSEAALRLLTPESVTPAVVYLVSKDAPSRTIVAAGAGTYARTRIYETRGLYVAPDERTAETIAAHWPQISDDSDSAELTMANDQTTRFLSNASAV